ncbi:hypothetical protein K466DRAFT_665627 [Polyporus arcularius HHB13444]|uniref:Uncharacterized protein n=1 Tax=Polyporus arcularius HHB13444 TaxID=1314778 RepID=A0A5C3P247_9APHY|nr:hypothetical protein K466DRAFT_665627 [Polyporus arcularius HHB13444]
MSRRHRPRRHAPVVSPEPQPTVQIASKYCDAVAGEDVRHGPLLCPNRIPTDGPRLCAQHSRDCADSYRIYKDASLRAEVLQPRILEFSRRNKSGGFSCLTEVGEAIEITDDFIAWATRELQQRRVHTTRFYAYDSPDPGHETRMAKVRKLIDVAESVLYDLGFRQCELEMAARRERERGLLGTPRRQPMQQPLRPHSGRPREQEEEAPVVCVGSFSCFSIRLGGHVDDEPKLDESVLGETMAEGSDEWFADERVEIETEEMLRWYWRYSVAC